jgi:hypothetical protein
VLTAFFNLCQTGSLAQTTSWVGPAPATNTFFNTSRAYFLQPTPASPSIPFEPFAQKLSFDERSEIFVRGDLHGDVRSLLANLTWLNEKGYLRDFQIVRTNFAMIFLGDYTDRGAYGVEVLYTLLRLKLANPERVFLLRGNHEDVSLQARYGFFEEGQSKYVGEFDAARIARAFDFLPVVIYLGTGHSFIQCNHGGMEPGFSPGALLEAAGASRLQLIGMLDQRQFLNGNAEWMKDVQSRQTASDSLRDFRPEDPMFPEVLGFMWNDFTVQAGEPSFATDPGRAFVYGARTTAALLRASSTTNRQLQAVFRAHQHSSVPNPMMRRLVASGGIFRHWQAADSAAFLEAPVERLKTILEREALRAIPPGSVWTFNVGADSVYGEACDFRFDSFGLLKLAPSFADWRLHVINLPLKL